jgi:hypothetical protein
MTPQERQLVSDLFDRLASLENSSRDADAERVITEGFRRAPNAAYALVQTVLVQDEALKRAEAHIRELEGGAQPEEGGFLDSMRQVFLGRTQQGAGRGSVPSVGGSKWNSGQVTGGGFQGNPQQQPPYQQNYQPEPQRGGSFLGTAAATAAGVIGGSILFNSLGSMFGNRGQAFASPSDGERGSPWGGDASRSDLAREAGYNDIGGGRGGDSDRGGASSLFGDQTSDSEYDDSDYDDGGDFGGGDMSDA